jgi:beta-galactosidase
MADGGQEVSTTTLESPGGITPGAATGHALILNEYGWLWLNRDGSPTELTKKLYPRLLGENASAKDRLELNAYLLAGITEYWRAYRQYAGVLHFVYLTGSDPEGYTSDHFHDVERLDLNPEFMDYMSNAFAPMGVYLNFWKPSLTAGSTQSVQVMMVNDQPRPAEGSLTIALEAVNGELLGEKTTKFSLAPLGQQTYYIDFSVPQTIGKFLLKAIANETGGRSGGSTTSRRRVNILAAKRDTD